MPIEPEDLLHARAALGTANPPQLHLKPHGAPQHRQIPDPALYSLMQALGHLAAPPTTQVRQVARMQLHPHHLLLHLQVRYPKSLPKRQAPLILSHLSGALGSLMIGRTTIMAESAPLSFLGHTPDFREEPKKRAPRLSAELSPQMAPLASEPSPTTPQDRRQAHGPDSPRSLAGSVPATPHLCCKKCRLGGPERPSPLGRTQCAVHPGQGVGA